MKIKVILEIEWYVNKQEIRSYNCPRIAKNMSDKKNIDFKVMFVNNLFSFFQKCFMDSKNISKL